MAAREKLVEGSPGWHLRQAADRAGKSAVELGKALGVDQTTVRRWWRWGTSEDGRELGGKKLTAYARACGVTAEEALGEVERPSPRSVQMALVRMARGLAAGQSVEQVMEAMVGEPPTPEEVQRLTVPLQTMRRYFQSLAALTDEQLLSEIERLEHGLQGRRGGALDGAPAAIQ